MFLWRDYYGSRFMGEFGTFSFVATRDASGHLKRCSTLLAYRKRLPNPSQPIPHCLRRALWRDVGLICNATGLARLASQLLARDVAHSVACGAEISGAHFRSACPAQDMDLAGKVFLRHGSGARVERWI